MSGGADGVDMGDAVAQRVASDAESIGCDEVREPRRRDSPVRSTVQGNRRSMCRQGMQLSDRGVKLACKGRGRAE